MIIFHILHSPWNDYLLLYIPTISCFGGIILFMRPANERRCYIVTSSVITGRINKMIPGHVDVCLRFSAL